MTASSPTTGRPGPPVPLMVAAALVLLESVALVGFGLLEVTVLSSTRLTMGVTTAAFFLVYGAGLAYCAWAFSRLRSWARAPLVLAQLIQILVAWSFVGGGTTPVAVVLAAGAVLVLIGIFHRASLQALADHDAGTED